MRLAPFQDRFKLAFPDMAIGEYQKTSEFDPFYNCIAWAAGEDQGKWWPVEINGYAWPIEPREETVECFFAAFATLGYAPCSNGDLEDGCEKVAIYVLDEAPTHAARQLPNGKWTSKIGEWEDFQHESPSCIEGKLYGRAAFFLKRPRQT